MCQRGANLTKFTPVNTKPISSKETQMKKMTLSAIVLGLAAAGAFAQAPAAAPAAAPAEQAAAPADSVKAA